MQEFFEKVRQDSKKQRRWLRAFQRGCRWTTFGKRGVLLARQFDGFRDVMGTILHWQIMVFLWRFTQKFLPALLIHLGFHAFFWIAGAILTKVFGNKLDQLQAEYAEHRTQYLHQRRVQFGFDGYWRMHYEDGCVVGEGFAAAPMLQNVGNMQILQLEKSDDHYAYFEQSQKDPGSVAINQQFGSIAFKKKIGLVLHNTTPMQCMKFMTPAKQLALVQSEELKHFEKIHLDDDQLTAVTKSGVEIPRGVNVYEKRELMDCFREADRYCQQLRSWADLTHNNLEKISFLRGA